MAEIVITDEVLKEGLKLAGRTSALNWQWGDWALTAMAPAGSARAKRAYLDAAREQLLAMGASEDGVPSVAELLRWAEVAAEVPPDARKNASVSAWQELIGAMPEATREEREAKLAELRAASPRGKVSPTVVRAHWYHEPGCPWVELLDAACERTRERRARLN